MTLTQAQRIVLPDWRLAVSKRFGRYKNEEKKDERISEVKENEIVKRLIEAWQLTPAIWHYNTVYASSQRLITGLRFSPKEIEQFCISLSSFQGEEYFSFRAGIFISALINKGSFSKNKIYKVFTTHLDDPFIYLGHRNRKNIIVVGNVGHHAGIEMIGGSIVVEGNADSCVGQRMSGGTITIKGNCGSHVGDGMSGGEIFVEGNAGDGVGIGMNCGEIYVAGNIESIGNMGKRRIYQRGRLILDK